MKEQVIDINALVQDDHNFNKGTEAGRELMEKSFKQLGAGRSVLIDKDGRIIAGNKSQKAAIAAGIKKVRIIETTGDELVAVKRTDISLDSKEGRELALADNLTTQVNLAWDEVELDKVAAQEGIDLPEWGIDPKELGIDTDEDMMGDEPDKEVVEKDEHAEELLNAAMKQYAGEFREHLDKAIAAGFFVTGLSKGYAKLQFLNAKYYGRKYRGTTAIVFAPEMFMTKSKKNGKSYYDILLDIANSESNVGIAGLRTVSHDGTLMRLLGSSYPVGTGGRSCLDFPVNTARDLIQRYAGKNARVLDPCHGWGGRLTGALIESVKEYVGVDPSDIAHRALTDIYDTFGEYQDTKVRLIKKPYEKTTDEEVGTGFDFALTSPPYFDVEDYQTGEQSHKQYNNYELWVQMFYEPLIRKTMQRLRDGGVFALQVGSQTYPLRKDALRICKELGYSTEVEEKTLNADALHGTDNEIAECTIIIRKL